MRRNPKGIQQVEFWQKCQDDEEDKSDDDAEEDGDGYILDAGGCSQPSSFYPFPLKPKKPCNGNSFDCFKGGDKACQYDLGQLLFEPSPF